MVLPFVFSEDSYGITMDDEPTWKKKKEKLKLDILIKMMIK